jgi:hypothetical protein
MRPLALWLGVGLLLVGDTEFEPDLDRAGLPRLVHPSHLLGEPAPDHLGRAWPATTRGQRLARQATKGLNDVR